MNKFIIWLLLVTTGAELSSGIILFLFKYYDSGMMLMLAAFIALHLLNYSSKWEVF